VVRRNDGSQERWERIKISFPYYLAKNKEVSTSTLNTAINALKF